MSESINGRANPMSKMDAEKKMKMVVIWFLTGFSMCFSKISDNQMEINLRSPVPTKQMDIG